MIEAADTRTRLTIEDLHASVERNRRWGRWGPGDELGTLNHVSRGMIAAAARLVCSGKTFWPAMNCDINGPQRMLKDNKRFNPVHTFFVTGVDCCADMSEFRALRGADDMITMPLQCGTQWDALSHIFYYDKMWNGYDARLVRADGAKKCGIETTRDKIVGRGVLLDIPRHRGLPWLPDGYGIGVELLDACDTWGVEVRPNEVADIFQPWHWIVIPMIGLTLGEMFYLKELAQDCAEDGIYEFFFCGAALPFTGAVGCPLNPMAMK